MPGASPVPAQMWQRRAPVAVQMWQRRAQSRCRCGSGEPSPGADAGTSLRNCGIRGWTGPSSLTPERPLAFRTTHRSPHRCHTTRHLSHSVHGASSLRTNARRCHICTATGLAPVTSARGLRSRLPHLHRDSAHACHICTATGPTPVTSAPGPTCATSLHMSAATTRCRRRAAGKRCA